MYLSVSVPLGKQLGVSLSGRMVHARFFALEETSTLFSKEAVPFGTPLPDQPRGALLFTDAP